MTDQEIVNALIDRDACVTAQFFFRDCRPLLLSIIRRVFGTQQVDYDEIISELYIHLMENDAHRLRQFKFESTFYQWLKTTAIRYCMRLKSGKMVIDNESQWSLNYSDINKNRTDSSHAKMDIESLLGSMKNQRYAKVIRMMVIEDVPPKEVAKVLSVTVDNLYNIKRRAMASLIDVAFKDKKYYVRQQYHIK